MRIKFFFKQASKYFVLTIVSLTILLAILLSTARFVAPYINKSGYSYNPLFQTWLSKKIQRPVTLGAVHLEWQGFDPTVELTDLVILGPQPDQVFIAVKKVKVRIDLLASLLHWALKTNALSIAGLELQVQQLADGRIEINHVPITDGDFFKHLFLSQKNIELNQVTVRWVDANGILVELPDIVCVIHPVETAAAAIQLNLMAYRTEVNMPRFFDQPLDFPMLEGQIEFQQQVTGSWIRTRNLFVQIPGLNITHNLDLWLPKQVNPLPGGVTHSVGMSPEINLVAHFNGNDLAQVKNYLPRNLLANNKGLNKWLQEMQLRAKMMAGSMVLRGALQDFPFDKQEGYFGLKLKLHQAKFRYLKDWPSVEKLNATIVFNGRQMHATDIRGQTDHLVIDNAEVKITDLQHPKLVINALSDAQLAAARQFLSKTPLRARLQDLIQSPLQGWSKLAVQIIAPLGPKTPPVQVKGQAVLREANLYFPEWKLLLDHINGAINFTDNDIKAKNMHAQLLKQPINIGVSKNGANTSLDVQAAKLIVLDHVLHQLKLKLSPEKSRWVIDITSDEIAGNIVFPRDKKEALSANLTKLYLPALTKKKIFSTLKPNQLPALRISSDDFRYGDYYLGHFAVDVMPEDDGLNIKQLLINSRDFHFIADGYWQQLQREQHTYLQGRFSIKNVGSFLASTGLSNNMREGHGGINFQLHWQDTPFAVSLKKLEGHLGLRFERGRIVHLSKTTQAEIGVGRVLNLFSLQDIPRRLLSLDFRDFSHQGFIYDVLKGDFFLRDGNAITHNAYLEGSVANVELKGQIGLLAKNYQLTLAVIPHVTSSLPIVATLAGGPLAGAVTLLVDTAFGDHFDNVARRTYWVTGPWDNPHITSQK